MRLLAPADPDQSRIAILEAVGAGLLLEAGLLGDLVVGLALARIRIRRGIGRGPPSRRLAFQGFRQLVRPGFLHGCLSSGSLASRDGSVAPHPGSCPAIDVPGMPERGLAPRPTRPADPEDCSSVEWISLDASPGSPSTVVGFA